MIIRPQKYALILLMIVTQVAHAQFTVKGTVADFQGEPLMGVNIVEMGTNNGTITDVEGKYQLQVKSSEAAIEFSFIGFVPEQVNVNGRSEIDMVMMEDVMQLMDIEIVGSRSLNRSATETPVPVDIIPLSEIATTSGQLDVNQMLQYVAPSYNANQQSGADGSDHVDPASIRGLGPDQTLVLLNGKRRHQSSLINIFGTRGRGNTGTDLNAIPVSAIDRIEILRDGASAQYGSDAIAGVINIVLKSSVNEFTGFLTTGVRSEGDGEKYQVSGNYGFKIGNKGFVNLTMDYLRKGRTNRAADPEEFDVYRRQFGDAESDNFGLYFNSEIPLQGETRFYAFGGYNFRDTDAYAWTREADEDRNVQAIYPNGFDPHIQSKISDRSVSAGIKSNVKGWKVDFNNTYGENIFHYYVDGSLNASLLERSPTRFDAGGFSLSQNTTGLHFTKFNENTLEGTNVAFGTEYRVENYVIFAGEEASWKNYGVIDTVINQVVVPWDALQRPGGSQGFPGFRPDNEVDEYRTNLAGYVDVEVDFTESFMMAAAVRGEKYSDFGSTINGKLASRLAIMDNLAIRGSVSTGFRAPSLAQIYFNSVFTDFVAGEAVDKLIAKNNSPITRTLGIPELKQEKALNFSAGLTTQPIEGLSITIDGYFVDIQDRIVLTGAFEDSDPQIGDELQALNVGAAQFFTNAVDTRTTGVDIIIEYTTPLGIGNFTTTLATNFNDMTIEDIKTSPQLAGKEDTYFGIREQYFLLESAPDSKINLTFNYNTNRFQANLRFVRFDEVRLIDWFTYEDPADYGMTDQEAFENSIDQYDAKITTDLSMGYKITDNLQLIIGGSNIFDAIPDKQDPGWTETGGFWDPVQMGFNGAFYYAKLGVKF